MSGKRKSQAVVFESCGEAVVRDVDIPACGKDDIVIETAVSWISPGTELSFLLGQRITGEIPWTPGSPIPFPLVPGYQKVGKIAAVGENVTGMNIGQTVFNTVGYVEGMYTARGGHLRWSIAPSDQVFAIPEKVDPEQFSGAVLAQVGYNCGARPEVSPGDQALVIGDGLVGQWTAQTLQQRGARVILIGHHRDRLARFRTQAEDRIFLFARHDGLGRLKQELDGPVHVLVDTVGSTSMVTGLVDTMVRGGQIISAGFYGLDDRFAVPPLRPNELTIHMVSGWRRDRLERTIDWIGEGRLETASLITHRLPVEEAPRAYQMLLNRSDHALGVLLQW